MTTGNSPVPATHHGIRYTDRQGVPLWATVLLGRVQGGLTIEQARMVTGSKVSPDTIAAYGSLNPQWHADLTDAELGVLKGEPISPRAIARARALPITDRLADIAMGDVPGATQQPYYRDQISAGRTVLEVEGALSQPPTDTPTGQIAAVLAKLDLTVRVASVVPSSPPIVPPASVVDVPVVHRDGTDTQAPGVQDADTGAP